MNSFFTHVFKLKDVQRFAGKSLNSNYSVGEHSFRVAALSMAIADSYNLENPKDKVCVEKVLRKAILHDLEESITNDIPSPVKDAIKELRDLLRVAGEKLLRELTFIDAPKPKDYLNLWIRDKKGLSGEVITVADKLEGMLSSYFEVKNGNASLTKAFVSHLEWFGTQRGMRLLNKYSVAKNEFLDIAAFVVEQETMHKDIDAKSLRKIKKEIENHASSEDE